MIKTVYTILAQCTRHMAIATCHQVYSYKTVLAHIHTKLFKLYSIRHCIYENELIQCRFHSLLHVRDRHSDPKIHIVYGPVILIHCHAEPEFI